jgi:hypothetical protein
MKWVCIFRSLEGWFAHGDVFKTRKAATAFATQYASEHTRVIDFDVRKI